MSSSSHGGSTPEHTVRVFMRVWKELYLTVFVFGAGTSLGELPPFLVARMTRLASASKNASGAVKQAAAAPLDSSVQKMTREDDTCDTSASVSLRDDDVTAPDADSLCHESNTHHDDIHDSVPPASPFQKMAAASPIKYFTAQMPSSDTVVMHVQSFAESHQILAFFGILTLASIPNPLFDCAGIVCGYAMLPAHIFLLATILGKTFIKMSLQISFIILMFSSSGFSMLEYYSTQLLPSSQASMIINFVHQQRSSIHKPEDSADGANGSLLTVGNACNAVMIAMVCYMAINVARSITEHLRLMRRKGFSLFSLHSMYHAWCSDMIEEVASSVDRSTASHSGAVVVDTKPPTTPDSVARKSKTLTKQNTLSTSCGMESMDSLCTADDPVLCEMVTSSAFQ